MVSPENALSSLLGSLFRTSRGLQGFLQVHYGARLARGRSVKKRQAVHAVAYRAASRLIAAELVNDALFDALLEARPKRQAEIDQVREVCRGLFGDGGDEGIELSDVALRYARAAAVLDTFDPMALQPTGEAVPMGALVHLSSHVVVHRGRWMLELELRRQVLRELARDDTLRAAAFAANADTGGRRSAMLGALFAGSDFSEHLWGLPLDELVDLRVVVTWAERITPGQVNQAELAAAIDQREQVESLRKLTERFKGRTTELDRLEAHAEGQGDETVLMIWGPGGVGKSSLVGAFLARRRADELAVPLPWVYIDFDDPGHDPGRPATVLASLCHQLASLYRGKPEALRHFLRAEAATERKRGLDAALEELVAGLQALPLDAPILLVVLDTFEQVQVRGPLAVDRVRRLVRRLSGAWEHARVIVSGRGPVAGWPNELHLANLDDESADAVLQAQGVHNSALRHSLIEELGGNPLTLRLAADAVQRSADDGGEGLSESELSKLVAAASEQELQGQLYTRILGHIQDLSVRRLAHPGLVVRRVTPEVITHVLAEPCELNPALARDLFGRLPDHASLFTRADDGAILHRQDVRTMMLRLMAEEESHTDVVRDIHERAAAWYATRPTPTDRAEELYHRLMLGEPAAVLDRLWSRNLGSALVPAWQEPMPESSRAWLGPRIGFDSGTTVVAPDAWRLELEELLERGEVDRARAVGRDAVQALAGQGRDAELAAVMVLSARAAKEAGDTEAAQTFARRARALSEEAGDGLSKLEAELLLVDLEAAGADRMADISQQYIDLDQPMMSVQAQRVTQQVVQSGAPLRKEALRKGMRTLYRGGDTAQVDAFELSDVVDRMLRIDGAASKLADLGRKVGLGGKGMDSLELAGKAIRYGHVSDVVDIALDEGAEDEELQRLVLELAAEDEPAEASQEYE